MSLKAPSGGGQRPLPPTGAHPAICYAIIDIGRQTKTFAGKDPQVTPCTMIIWEFPNLPKQTFDDAKGPQPFAISQEYTVSLSEKSNLYKALMSWRGVAPTDLEKELPLFLGQACLINVIHNQSADKTKTYANVGGIMRLPQGMQVGPMSNPKVFFNLDNYSHESFMQVPEWIRKKIMISQEWSGIVQRFGNPPESSQPVQQGFNTPPQNNFQPQQNFQPSANVQTPITNPFEDAPPF
jgi:hypothetical protein